MDNPMPNLSDNRQPFKPGLASVFSGHTYLKMADCVSLALELYRSETSYLYGVGGIIIRLFGRMDH